MKHALWSILRLIISILFMLVVVVVMFFFEGILYAATGYDLDLSENYIVVIPMILAFLGSFLIAYCPRCKLVITTRTFSSFWDRFNHDIPRCPKCEKKGPKCDVRNIY